MKRNITNSLVVFLLLIPSINFGQEIKQFDFKGIEPFLHKSNDSVYVINFWATWCLPCVKEIPAFEKLHETYRNEKLSVILVSLDFPNKLEQSLIPFIQKNNIQSKVMLLNDPDSNSWIDKVDPSWSGAIPGTLIYDSSSRKFYEKSFTYEELENIISEKIKLKKS